MWADPSPQHHAPRSHCASDFWWLSAVNSSADFWPKRNEAAEGAFSAEAKSSIGHYCLHNVHRYVCIVVNRNLYIGSASNGQVFLLFLFTLNFMLQNKNLALHNPLSNSSRRKLAICSSGNIEPLQ